MLDNSIPIPPVLYKHSRPDDYFRRHDNIAHHFGPANASSDDAVFAGQVTEFSAWSRSREEGGGVGEGTVGRPSVESSFSSHSPRELLETCSLRSCSDDEYALSRYHSPPPLLPFRGKFLKYGKSLSREEREREPLARVPSIDAFRRLICTVRFGRTR